MHVDDQILDGCIAGKRNAQYLLFQKYASRMMGLCMRYANDKDDAKDLLQEGFIKVFENIGSFRREGSLEGWIRRIMINNAINITRKKRGIPFHEDIEKIPEIEIPENNDHDEFPQISQEELFLMIQSLPDGYRMVFNLYVIEEYSHKEIAEILGISENTSKTQLLKARRFLRNSIGLKNKKQNI
ncbi:MAG: RNA polymerase sigma factor [Bacteroidota bacterium]|nr:RNA polymerase sigma factor [Bacteroidota bacterium]